MKNIEKAERIHLGSLIEELKKGHFVIPDFQREFEWKPWDVLDLIRSIFMDYYIGTLLLWKGSEHNFNVLSCESIYAFQGKPKPLHIVLDGQQRLTAIHYAFFQPEFNFPRRKNQFVYFLRINELLDEDYDNAFFYNSLTQKYQSILKNPAEQFEEHLFPLGMMKEGSWEINDWIKGYKDFWQEKADTAENSEEAETFQNYSDNADKFREIIRDLFDQYYISSIELDKDIDVSKVCDIFTRINSTGVRLDIFDLLNAMLRPKDIFLKEMWNRAKDSLSYTDSKKMKIYILQVMSILEQSYCSPKYLYYLVPEAVKTIKTGDGSKEKTVLIKTSEEFLKRWDESVNSLEKAINILKNPRDYGAVQSNFVPYPSIIPAFAAVKRYAETCNLKNKIDIQAKIRRWYWSSIFTNRYSSAVESTSAKDFQDLIKWFESDEKEPDVIGEFETSYRSIDLLNLNKGSAIYNAIFNLFIIKGARDWETFDLPGYDALDDHHIVPVSVFKNEAGSSINSILNRTPLTPHTNRHVISNRMPNEYIKEMFDHNDESKVYEILASHLLSKKAVSILLRDPFTREDFLEFLEERKNTIFQAIENLLIKETVPLSVDLKKLNEEVEQVELSLRNLIAETANNLSSNPYQEFTPSHIREKVDQRIEREMKKRPGLTNNDFTSFEKILTFFDLQEYNQFITNKINWQHFEARFKTKPQLEHRFNQLAALRNGIRHSREITDIDKNDGTSAILWFKEALK